MGLAPVRHISDRGNVAHLIFLQSSVVAISKNPSAPSSPSYSALPLLLPNPHAPERTHIPHDLQPLASF